MSGKRLMLKDLIERIDWVILSKGSGPQKVQNNEVAVSYFIHDKKKYKDRADYVRIKIGIAVIEKLGWMSGDRILSMGDPDDVFSFLMVRSDQNIGRKLTRDINSTTHTVVYKWTRPIPIRPMKLTRVEYDTHEKYLHFHLPQSD